MQNQALADFLTDCGVCQICQLRHLQARGNEYENIQNTLSKLNVTANIDNAKRQRLEICPVCLGLFSGAFVEQLIEGILAADINKYDCNGIVISMQLPILLQIRQLSMWFALLQKFPAEMDRVRAPDVPLKEAIKLILNPIICKRLQKTCDANGITIHMQLQHVAESNELDKLTQLRALCFPAEKKQKISRGFFDKLCTPKFITSKQFAQFFATPPGMPTECLSLQSISLTGPTVFVAGRYRKLTRALSHTPWLLNGQRVMQDSIEEIIIRQVAPYFNEQTQKIIFMSSGREDVDVRCLGKGRPFVLEIPNALSVHLPKSKALQMQQSIAQTQQVSVRDLQLVAREELVHIKSGEEQKRKYYRALCKLQQPATVEMLQKLQLPAGFEIQQKTPIRVLHRRPLHTRPRRIFSLKAYVQRDNAQVLVLDIVSQAGTYIKELVHGEFGRTTPSVASLIQQPIDILALDVIGIDLDWPAEVDNDSV